MKPIDFSMPPDLVPGDAKEFYASKDGKFTAGFWASGPMMIDVHYTEDEFCFLLAGQVQLTGADGATRLYQTGDGFIIPSGFSGTWQSIGQVQKYYVIYQP